MLGGYFLYFIKAGKFVKIGVAKDISRRIKELQTGNPHELQLIHAEWFTDKYAALDAEKKLHAHFRDIQTVGEWFEAMQVEFYINALHDNTYRARPQPLENYKRAISKLSF